LNFSNDSLTPSEAIIYRKGISLKIRDSSWNNIILITNLLTLKRLNMKKSMIVLLVCLMANMLSSQTLVKLKLPNNCNAAPQAVDNVLADKKLELFPNPNSGNFTLIISFDDIIDKAIINIYDTKGKSVYYEIVFSDSNKLVKQINIGGLLAGTYIFEVKNTQQVSTTKLVINK
jgi:hypothetical protein